MALAACDVVAWQLRCRGRGYGVCRRACSTYQLNAARFLATFAFVCARADRDCDVTRVYCVRVYVARRFLVGTQDNRMLTEVFNSFTPQVGLGAGACGGGERCGGYHVELLRIYRHITIYNFQARSPLSMQTRETP